MYKKTVVMRITETNAVTYTFSITPLKKADIVLQFCVVADVLMILQSTRLSPPHNSAFEWYLWK